MPEIYKSNEGIRIEGNIKKEGIYWGAGSDKHGTLEKIAPSLSFYHTNYSLNPDESQAFFTIYRAKYKIKKW